MKNTNNCAEITDYIFFINDLKKEEKEEMYKHISSCSDCNSLYQKINQINYHLSAHLKDKLITEYILTEEKTVENESNISRLSTKEISKINQHLEDCRICREKYDKMQSMYLEMNKYWMDSELPDFEIKPFNLRDKKSKSPINQKYIHKRIVYSALATAAVIMLLLLTLVIDWYKPSINKVAELDDIQIPISIRSGNADGLQRGILFFNKKNYHDAIKEFQQFINGNHASGNKNYVEYLLGLSYLKLYNHNNQDLLLIDKSINELSKALILLNNQNLEEDILWYLGKAHLLKNDIEKAMQYFEKVNELDGSRSGESKIIIEQLKDTDVFK